MCGEGPNHQVCCAKPRNVTRLQVGGRNGRRCSISGGGHSSARIDGIQTIDDCSLLELNRHLER